MSVFIVSPDPAANKAKAVPYAPDRLLAERYERGGVLLTSNLSIAGWEAIFKDPMTTALAIDRLVLYAVIIE